MKYIIEIFLYNLKRSYVFIYYVLYPLIDYFLINQFSILNAYLKYI